MAKPVLVINPNSSQAVTEGIDAALEPLRSGDGPPLETATLPAGPPGIETERHVTEVAGPLVDYLTPRAGELAGVVVACFSDPGVPVLREALPVPVVGAAEAAYLTAAQLSERFGVVSIKSGSLPRHRRHLRGLELGHKLAGDIAIERSVGALSGDDVARRMTAAGQDLVTSYGAGSVILGCCGMAHHRQALQASLGVPVIDPSQAGAAMALTRWRLDL